MCLCEVNTQMSCRVDCDSHAPSGTAKSQLDDIAAGHLHRHQGMLSLAIKGCCERERGLHQVQVRAFPVRPPPTEQLSEQPAA